MTALIWRFSSLSLRCFFGKGGGGRRGSKKRGFSKEFSCPAREARVLAYVHVGIHHFTSLRLTSHNYLSVLYKCWCTYI